MCENGFRVEWKDAFNGSLWEYGADDKPVAPGEGRAFETFEEAKLAAVAAADWAYAFVVDIRQCGRLVGGVITNRKIFS